MTPDLPLPQLPLPTRRASTADDPTWLVRVSAFRDPVSAASELAHILRIDLARAQHIAMNAPGVLVAGTTRMRAEQIANAVRTLGVRARVEDALDDGPLSSFPPPPRRSEAPVAPARPASKPSGAGRSFWLQVPVAFVAPFLGQGSLLLLASGGAGLAVLLTLLVPFFIVYKLAVGAFFGMVAVGVTYETFDRLAQSATLRDDDEWVGTPISRLPSMLELCTRGLVMSVVTGSIGLALVSLTPLTGSLELALGLLLLGFLYWPMALTVMSVRGSVIGLVDVVAVVRGIAAAPLEYLTVCVAMFAAVTGTTALVLGATGLTAGLGALADGGLVGVGATVFVLGFFYYAGIGYLHGVLGYLMGSLVRSKQDRFEFMLA